MKKTNNSLLPLKRKFSNDVPGTAEYFTDFENRFLSKVFTDVFPSTADYVDTDGPNLTSFKSLYQVADYLEETRTFQAGGANDLDSIASEIKVRVKITQQEIFKIGELLLIAKKLCQQEKRKFKQWIADNFDFSYELAVRWMHVFIHCLGWKEFALKVPVDILYKIAAPSFPEELREYLFTKGNLEKITGGNFNKLIEKYKQGGVEAIEDEVTELNKMIYTYRQSGYALDYCRSGLMHLLELREKIENFGAGKAIIPFEERMGECYEPEAKQINIILYTAIKQSIEIMTAAIEKAYTEFNTWVESNKDKM